MLELLSGSIFFHTEKSDTLDKLESGVYIRKIIEIAQNILLQLPVKEITQCLSKESLLAKYFADYLVFQGENCKEILPYLEEIDENLVKEYKYAESCIQALEAYKTMKQILLHEQVLPIANFGVFSKAVDFFSKIMPVLEFESGSRIPSAILDLNCYSIYIETNSTANPQKTQCENLLLGLLCCSIPSVVELTIQIMIEALDNDSVLSGIAEGANRKQLAKQVMLNSNILSVLVIKIQNTSIICKLMESPEDYELLLPLFTIIQSYPEENFEGILHMLTISTSALQPLRFIRDLFSVNNSRRAVAVMVLRNTNSPEDIQQEWHSLRENV